MGLFDSKWVVTFEYSNGILSFNKTGSMVVEASSEYSAKDKAKSILKGYYKYVKVVSAIKADSKGRPIIDRAPVTITEEKSSYASSSNPIPTRELTSKEKKTQFNKIVEETELTSQKKERIIELKEEQIKKIQTSTIKNRILIGIIFLGMFLLGWIPYWHILIEKDVRSNALDMWIELGHSKTDSHGQNLVALVDSCTDRANSVLWLPFVILGVQIVISIVLFVFSKKKTSQKVMKLKEDLKKLKE